MAAYVMRSSHDVSLVILYQLAIYVAVPVAFVLNGLLLGPCRSRVSIRRPV